MFKRSSLLPLGGPLTGQLSVGPQGDRPRERCTAGVGVVLRRSPRVSVRRTAGGAMRIAYVPFSAGEEFLGLGGALTQTHTHTHTNPLVSQG